MIINKITIATCKFIDTKSILLRILPPNKDDCSQHNYSNPQIHCQYKKPIDKIAIGSKVNTDPCSRNKGRYIDHPFRNCLPPNWVKSHIFSIQPNKNLI